MLSARITLLCCLMLYLEGSQAIMVKFGTKDGPIEPPAPTTEAPPPVKPYRAPAPVWEERENDNPDPNAEWRPQKFTPQGIYTSISYLTQQNNAQKFVNSYLPKKHQPIPAPPVTNYFTPTQLVSGLSSQNLPGFGIRYFAPAFVPNVEKEQKKQEDAKINDIETNEVDVGGTHDQQWKNEKEFGRRVARHNQEASYQQPPVRPHVYQWPAFVSRNQ